MIPIPNKFPSTSIPILKRIAIINEFPSSNETRSEYLLKEALSIAGVSLADCFRGNICQHTPPSDNFSLFNSWLNPLIQSSLIQLKEDIAKFNPNIIICLGQFALKAAKDNLSPSLNPKTLKFKISPWRGSLFLAEHGPMANHKCIATFAPSFILRKGRQFRPLFGFDLQRAITESLTPILTLPERILITNPSFEHTITTLKNILSSSAPIALDIEGGIDSMSCISFATNSCDAFIVPFSLKSGHSYWLTLEQELIIWQALARVLECPTVPKILQNSLYDTFVLHYSYGIRVRGVVNDTMLLSWEKYPELRKSLALQTSIYTRQPYYKFMRLQHEEEENE